ncbi:MAG: HIT family protein [bacterium]|nr:HIT family protein [bacterium]
MLNCIFCKIVRGELPSIKVYEDDATLAFLDINPVHPGHTLVVPKEHAGNIFEISSEHWASVQETVRKVAVAVEKATEADGVNMLMNNREHAGQVVDHAHVHLIPRFQGDGLNRWPHKPLDMQEGSSLAEKIRGAL